MAWNRTSLDEIKRLIPDFIWYGCFLSVLSLLLLSHFILVRKFPALRPAVWVTVGAIVGTTLGMLVSSGRKKHWVYRTLYPIPTTEDQRKWYLIGFFVVLMIAFFDDWGHLKDVLDRHGS